MTLLIKVHFFKTAPGILFRILASRKYYIGENCSYRGFIQEKWRDFFKMKNLVFFCFLTGCTTVVQYVQNMSSRGLASVNPSNLFCQRLGLSHEKEGDCLQIANNNEISDSVLSLCANLDTKPEKKVECLGIVAGKEINGALVSASVNWQASPKQTLQFLGDIAGKDVSGFAVSMCEELWKTAQQRMNCVLESLGPVSSATDNPR